MVIASMHLLEQLQCDHFIDVSLTHTKEAHISLFLGSHVFGIFETNIISGFCQTLDTGLKLHFCTV